MASEIAGERSSGATLANARSCARCAVARDRSSLSSTDLPVDSGEMVSPATPAEPPLPPAASPPEIDGRPSADRPPGVPCV